MPDQRNRLKLLTISLLSITALLYFLRSPFADTQTLTQTQTQSSLTTSNPDSKMGPGGGIVHIVMFEFQDGVTREQVLDVCNHMLALKTQCLHPTTKAPYVKSAMGGKDNSPEGLSAGITHIFVEEFENEDDRKYYLEKDPAHLAFVKSIGDVVKRAQVVDFVPGVF